jgi:hypothetical protein
MLNPSFVYVGNAIALAGTISYMRDTYRGATIPNRVSWLMWGIATTLVGIAEVSQGVGLPALMGFVFGAMDLTVFGISFLSRHGTWDLEVFDIACGISAVLGLIVWALSANGTLALIAFLVADGLASLPTLWKSWRSPESETALGYASAGLCGLITAATIKHWTFTSAAFPLWIGIVNGAIVFLVKSKIGRRLKGTSAK